MEEGIRNRLCKDITPDLVERPDERLARFLLALALCHGPDDISSILDRASVREVLTVGNLGERWGELGRGSVEAGGG